MSDGPTDASCSKYDRVLLSLIYSTLSDRQYGHCKTAGKRGHVRRQDMNLILEGHQPDFYIGQRVKKNWQASQME